MISDGWWTPVRRSGSRRSADPHRLATGLGRCWTATRDLDQHIPLPGRAASVGIVVPIVIPIAQSAGVGPVIRALAAVFGASYGFMLPVSTPPNAIVCGSGLIPITKMVRSRSGVRRRRRRSDHHGREHHGERRGPRLRGHSCPRLSRSQRSPYTFGALLTGGANPC